MAPEYKLSYFESRGLAEPVRLLFALRGIEYEDIRYKREDWPNHKSKYPWGVLPVLEEGDKVITQSHAIQRYLAKKYDLAGQDDFEFAKCDELVETLADLRQQIYKAFFEPDELKKAELSKVLKEETFPKFLKKLNEILEQNGDYLTGTLTYADLHIASFLEIFEESIPSLLDSFPSLKSHQKRVFNLPGIKEWMAKRPRTQY